MAFEIASQIYAAFGYRKIQVPFGEHGEVTFDSDSIGSKLAALRSYLQGAFSTRLSAPVEDVQRSVFWFHPAFDSGPSVGVSEEFAEDAAGDESSLFKNLDRVDLQSLVASIPQGKRLILTTEGPRAG
jgi:hypothetical protein